jgi:hypothetical protein
MITQTHTPGPWSLLTARTLVNVKGAKGEQICQVPKNSADARLIAAAPELLEAAEKLEQWLGPIAKVFWAEDDAETEHLQALDALRGAIAKARGE